MGNKKTRQSESKKRMQQMIEEQKVLQKSMHNVIVKVKGLESAVQPANIPYMRVKKEDFLDGLKRVTTKYRLYLPMHKQYEQIEIVHLHLSKRTKISLKNAQLEEVIRERSLCDLQEEPINVMFAVYDWKLRIEADEDLFTFHLAINGTPFHDCPLRSPLRDNENNFDAQNNKLTCKLSLDQQ